MSNQTSPLGLVGTTYLTRESAEDYLTDAILQDGVTMLRERHSIDLPASVLKGILLDTHLGLKAVTDLHKMHGDWNDTVTRELTVSAVEQAAHPLISLKVPAFAAICQEKGWI